MQVIVLAILAFLVSVNSNTQPALINGNTDFLFLYSGQIRNDAEVVFVFLYIEPESISERTLVRFDICEKVIKHVIEFTKTCVE